MILSTVILIYIVVTPINSDFIKVTFLENPLAKYKLLNKILKHFESEFLILRNLQASTLRDIFLEVSNLISYYIQKEDLSHFAKEKATNYFSNEKDTFNNNLVYRYKEIERILFKFKQ